MNSVSSVPRDKKQCKTRLRCFTSKVRNGKISLEKLRQEKANGTITNDLYFEQQAELIRLAEIYIGVERSDGKNV